MVEKKLLEVRKAIKSRKPTFRRQQSNQFAKFKNDDAWRRPKGKGSKMRRMQKGHRKMPTVGYSSPKAVRGLTRDGFEEVLVYNVVDLAKIESKTQIAVIGRTVGGKKTLDILAKAKEMKLSIANVKDIDAKIKELTKAPKEKKVKSDKKAETKKVEKKAEVKEEVKTEAKKEEAKK